MRPTCLTELVERGQAPPRGGAPPARWSWAGDLAMVSRSAARTLDHPSDDTSELLASARRLLDEAWPSIEPVGLSLLGVSLSNLSERSAVQMGLDFSGRDRTLLDSTLDAVTERFGSGAITRGSLLGRAPVETPVLPDPPPEG
ncbi:MAG: hypothetical protein R2716_07115 [Microthrixaceae bacterium]